jgi:flagellar assembly protein FliH
MGARLDMAGAAVRPFQFPALREPPPAMPPPADQARAANGAAPDAAAARDAAHAAELDAARAAAIEAGFEEGREQGYAAGFAAGLAAGEAAAAEAVQRLTSIVASLGGSLTAFEQPVEEAVAALALEAARCVIGAEVKRSHEFLVCLVREAIAKVPLEMAMPRVLLSPIDLELVRHLAPDIDSAGAILVADDTIEAGGCIVVADGGQQPVKDRRWNPRHPAGAAQVDLTLAARWREVMLTLFDGEDE